MDCYDHLFFGMEYSNENNDEFNDWLVSELLSLDENQEASNGEQVAPVSADTPQVVNLCNEPSPVSELLPSLPALVDLEENRHDVTPITIGVENGSSSTISQDVDNDWLVWALSFDDDQEDSNEEHVVPVSASAPQIDNMCNETSPVSEILQSSPTFIYWNEEHRHEYTPITTGVANGSSSTVSQDVDLVESLGGLEWGDIWRNLGLNEVHRHNYLPIITGEAYGLPVATQMNVNGFASESYINQHEVPFEAGTSKKGKRNVWSDEEHRLFLRGLEVHGRGKWREISRTFVTTRTPTQIASHAQKYFIGLKSKEAKTTNRSVVSPNLPVFVPHKYYSYEHVRKFLGL